LNRAGASGVRENPYGGTARRNATEAEATRHNAGKSEPPLNDNVVAFVEDCLALASRLPTPSERVAAIAPRMLRLLTAGSDFLTGAHRRSDPSGYARNLIYRPDDATLSLYALVWTPGQWTPVHDHGTWGVVGVVEGVLEERAFLPSGGDIGTDSGIALVPGAINLLTSGSVTTFVPNPDHIHRTGVPEDRGPAISLHLYGNAMNSFHVYDVEAGTRRLVDVPHYES
jgi:predicted metal-dependent enzyme (double-stranded beta helix superfamily)